MRRRHDHRPASLALITLGVAAVMSWTAPTATAEPVWISWHEGSYGSYESCDAARPPSDEVMYILPCASHASDPDSRGRGAGWYYKVRLMIA